MLSILDKNGKQIADIGLKNFHLRQGAMIVAKMSEDSDAKAYLIKQNTIGRCLDQIRSLTDQQRILEYMFVLQRLTADFVDTEPSKFIEVAA